MFLETSCVSTSRTFTYNTIYSTHYTLHTSQYHVCFIHQTITIYYILSIFNRLNAYSKDYTICIVFHAIQLHSTYTVHIVQYTVHTTHYIVTKRRSVW